MAKHYLDKLFQPSAIAVFGATTRENAIGMKVFKNLTEANASRKIFAINPKYKKIFQHRCFASLDDIPDTIDVAIITTPAKTIPNIIASCGKKGIENVIIFSSGFSETGEDGKAFEKHILNIAEGYHIRVFGPNCLGFMRPGNQLNATFSPAFPHSGKLALISQSGTFTTSVIDWSLDKKIGFSSIISLGNSADIDFADILDYLTTDSETSSILLYIEGIRNARRFMSALRTAARMKPVIVIKAGNGSHTETTIDEDHVFDVALHRAGAVRVKTIEELFLAAEILSHYQTTGNRLVIDSNAISFDAMATAFSYLASYQINQQLLLQVPEPFSLDPKPNITLAKNVIEKAILENRKSLHREESIMILQAFGIPMAAELSPEHLRDLKIGVMRDSVFGPVINLGTESELFEMMQDRVFTLPPLNSFLARQLINKTYIPKMTGVDIHKILNILLRVSEMICEIPEIKALEIHSLLSHQNSGEVCDVEIIIDRYLHPIQRYSHMAIHPYPNQLISTVPISKNHSAIIRPIKPEDAEITQAFMRNLSSQSRYFRFMQHIRELTSTMLVRLTQIDYDREMTFIATYAHHEKEIGIGLAHYVTNPDGESCEFAIVIADEWQNKGIGSKLMNALTREAKAQQLTVMVGFVIATNTSMLELTQRLGFVVTNSDDPTVKIVTRYL